MAYQSCFQPTEYGLSILTYCWQPIDSRSELLDEYFKARSKGLREQWQVLQTG